MSCRSFPADTQVQKFYEEAINKERDFRLGWYMKSKPQGGAKKSSKQSEVFRRKIENDCKPSDGYLSKVRTDAKEPRYNKKIVRDDGFVGDTDIHQLLSAEMRPPSASTKGKLYDGFTKEGKGRYQYLLSRNQKNPEEKYTFPLTSSFEYGWKLSDVINKKDIKKPANGRTRIVADTFYTRTGMPADM